MDTLFDGFKETHTNNFKIRLLEESDFSDLFDIFSDFEVVRYQQIPPMESLDQAKGAVTNFIKGYKDKQKIRYCIIDDKKMIGIVSLHSFDFDQQKVEIGFMLNRNYWSKGVMTEAAAFIINYVFENTTASRIIAKPLPENTGSIRVCQKLKFVEVDYTKETILNFRTNKYEDQLIFELSKNHFNCTKLN